MQWTEPAGKLVFIRSRRGAGSATDRPYVSSPMAARARSRWKWRGLFGAIAVLSFVLSVVATVLWVRSYYGEDAVFIYHDAVLGERDSVVASSARGRCYVFYIMDGRTTKQEEPQLVVFHSNATAIPYLSKFWVPHAFLGFGVGFTNPASKFYDSWPRLALTAPHWGICLALAAFPALWVWRGVKRWRRHSAGFCYACGYDLRATPDRCPECGAEARGAAVS
jgi:hypothetical protein